MRALLALVVLAGCNALDEALRNALEGYCSTDWPLYRDVIRSLEQFTQQVKMSVATRKPL